MIRFVHKFISDFSGKAGGNLSGYVFKSSAQLFFLQCLSLALGFLVNFVFLRLIDLDTYGTYVYIFNLLHLLAGFSLLGVDTLLVKTVPVYYAAGQFRKLKGLLYFSFVLVVVGALAATFFSTKVLFLFRELESKTRIHWPALTLLSLFLLTLTAITRSCLQGLKKIIWSQVAENLIRPVGMMASVGVLWYAGKKVYLEQLVGINVAVTAAGLLLGFLFLRKTVAPVIGKLEPEVEARKWWAPAMGFYAVSLLHVLNSRVDIFLLGQLKGNAEVGVYNIALRISELLSFVLTVVNYVTAPLIARLHAEGASGPLQQLVTRSARAVLVLSLPLVMGVIVLRQQLLLFFGVDLLQGQEALLILSLGQLVNIGCGSVGLLLLMSGHHRLSLFSLVAALGLNVGLNFLLTPRYGIIGTAAGTAGSLALWNLLMYYFVRKKLKIRTTAFGVV